MNIATRLRESSTDAAESTVETPTLERVWQTVVWNDPINLMSYVSFVFQQHFGYDEARATELMMRVHHEGSAVVAEGSRQSMELHVEAMHGYGLWATVREGGEL